MQTGRLRRNWIASEAKLVLQHTNCLAHQNLTVESIDCHILCVCHDLVPCPEVPLAGLSQGEKLRRASDCTPQGPTQLQASSEARNDMAKEHETINKRHVKITSWIIMESKLDHFALFD